MERFVSLCLQLRSFLRDFLNFGLVAAGSSAALGLLVLELGHVVVIVVVALVAHAAHSAHVGHTAHAAEL